MSGILIYNMFNNLFEYFFYLAKKNIRTVLIFVLLLVAVSVYGLTSLRFDNNIESMLPADPVVKKSFSFLRNSNISDKIILSLSMKDDDFNLNTLINYSDKLSKKLKNNLVTEVVSGIPEENIMPEIIEFLDFFPQLFSQNDFSTFYSKTSPENIQNNVSNIYCCLMTPGANMMLPFLTKDPLSLCSGFLKNLKQLASALGYKITIKNGHFVSEDNKHVLMILKTPVLMTDGFGAKNVLEHIYNSINYISDDLIVNVVAGHRHTVSNEIVIRKDVKIIAIVASTAFFILFLLVFRDLRAAYIFIIPVLSVLFSINLSRFFIGSLSLFIVGFAAVITGIAIDYGIHVYVALKNCPENVEKLTLIKNISNPILIGALTTMSVFFAFFFSSVSGYSQLAFFSIVSIILCLIFSLFILPHIIKSKNIVDESDTTFLFNFSPKIVVTIWIICLFVCAGFSTFLHFNSDIKQFDGSDKSVFFDELEFHRVWGGDSPPAILVVEAKATEDALQKNDRIAKRLEKLNLDGKIISIASVYKSKKSRLLNLKKWMEFWSPEKIENVMISLNSSAVKLGFNENVFLPFKQMLKGEKQFSSFDNKFGFLNKLKQRFININNDKTQILTYFDDSEKNVRAVQNILTNEPSAYIVSGKKLELAISNSVSNEIIKLAGIAALLILFFIFILLKKVRLALLALVPVVSAGFVMLGILSIVGMQLNAVAIIAAMVVVGLCIDYGIFIVCNQKNKYKKTTRKAVALSALTTIIGAGALLFASHPVMFSIGLVLVSGVTAGFFSAVLVVPALYKLLIK